MKKIIIVIVLLAGINVVPAQKKEFTDTVDSTTSEIILRKYIKWNFAQNIFMAKIAGIYNPESYYYEKFTEGRYFGVGKIHLFTYALGDWAMKPDFKVYKSYYKSPWKNYTLYTLHVPKYTPRNDSITAYCAYREYYYDKSGEVREPEFYSTPLATRDLMAYNAKMGDLKLADPLYREPLTHKNDEDLVHKLNPDYEYTFEPKGYKRSLLKPENKERIRLMLKSELMKNIYAYRFLKSGIFDSLAEGRYLREDKYLFPLIDSLLPDFDDDLLMASEEINPYYVSGLVIWSFYYPGMDMVRKVSSNPYLYSSYVRKNIWERYFPLEPATYVVGYDTLRQMVRFISGKNIFLTRIADMFFHCFALNCDDRERVGEDFFSNLCTRLVKFKMLDKAMPNWDYVNDSYYAKEIGEDSAYKYFQIYGLTPIAELIKNDPPRGSDPETPPRLLWRCHNSRKCLYKVRMNMNNFELVDIIEESECDDTYEYYRPWW